MALDGEDAILLDRGVEDERLMSQDAVKPRGDSAREDVKAGDLDGSFETQCGHSLQVSQGSRCELSLVSSGAEACEAVMRKRGREAASVAGDAKQAGSKRQRRRLRGKTECSWKEYKEACEKSKETKLSANIAVEHETLEKAEQEKHNENMRKNCLHIQEMCRKIMNDSKALVINTGWPGMLSPQRPLGVPQKRFMILVLLDSGTD